jgi:hypothetical protein
LHIGALKFRADFLKSMNIILTHVNDETCKKLGSRWRSEVVTPVLHYTQSAGMLTLCCVAAAVSVQGHCAVQQQLPVFRDTVPWSSSCQCSGTLCCGAAAASVQGHCAMEQQLPVFRDTVLWSSSCQCSGSSSPLWTATLLIQWHSITIQVTIAAHVDNDKYKDTSAMLNYLHGNGACATHADTTVCPSVHMPATQALLTDLQYRWYHTISLTSVNHSSFDCNQNWDSSGSILTRQLVTGWTTEALWFSHRQGNRLFCFAKKPDGLLDAASSYAMQTGSAG